MVALPDRSFMSAEEYLLWEAQQEERHEYWDGEVVAMAGGTRRHNRVCFNWAKLLDGALGDCEVYINDVIVQVQGNRKFFYPDVVVTCDGRDQDERLVNYPCLIVEVLSPSTELFDRGAKFACYRRFSTLREYVLVGMEVPGVEVYTKGGDGRWVLAEYGMDEVVVLESIGVRVEVREIYDRVGFEMAGELEEEVS